MKTTHLDSLSDKRWQNAMSDVRAEAAEEAWTGAIRDPETGTIVGYVCSYIDFTQG